MRTAARAKAFAAEVIDACLLCFFRYCVAFGAQVMAKGFWQDTTDWLGVIAIGSVLLGVALKVLRTS